MFLEKKKCEFDTVKKNNILEYGSTKHFFSMDFGSIDFKVFNTKINIWPFLYVGY